MVAGLSLIKNLPEKDNLRVLVLGTGAGVFPMFMKTALGDSLKELVTVDINEDIVKVTLLIFYIILIYRLVKNTLDLLKMAN